MTRAKETIVLVNPPNGHIVLRDMYCSTISKGLYNWPNTDLLVVSGQLKGRYDVKFIDANSMGISPATTLDMILRHDPVGVCFSFGISVKDHDYAFVAELRKRLPGIKIIGTGGLLKFNAANELRDHPEFDACLLNFTTDDILKYFNSDYETLCNVVYRQGENIIETPLRYPPNGYAYPVPVHEQLPLEKYNLSHGRVKPFTTVLSGYGCPARCSYCVCEKIDYRYRDPANVIEELTAIKDLGIKGLFFRDMYFCANKKQGQELLEMMLKNKLGLSWVADTRADNLTDDLAALMKAAGCHALHIGVESASEGMLRKNNKGTDLDKIRKGFKICKRNGIKTVGYFILGLPGESADDVRRTIEFAIELDCDYASFNVPVPIVGTSLREDALSNGWLESPAAVPYDGSLVTPIETALLGREQINDLRRLAYRKFYLRPRYIYKALARLRTPYQVKMLGMEFINFLKRRV